MTGIVVGIADAGNGLLELRVRYEHAMSILGGRVYVPNTTQVKIWDRVTVTVETES